MYENVAFKAGETALRMLMPLIPNALSGTMNFGGLAKSKVKHVSLSADVNERAGQGVQTPTALSYLNELPSHGLQLVNHSFATFPIGHGLQQMKNQLCA